MILSHELYEVETQERISALVGERSRCNLRIREIETQLQLLREEIDRERLSYQLDLETRQRVSA